MYVLYYFFLFSFTRVGISYGVFRMGRFVCFPQFSSVSRYFHFLRLLLLCGFPIGLLDVVLFSR